jgi:hypothetical protein
MNRVFAFAWLVIIGTNVAAYYSEDAPFPGLVILAGSVYFLFRFRVEFLRLLFFAEYALVLGILSLPILLMLLSSHSFERGAYTSQVAVVITFATASVIALRPDLRQTVAAAAFAVVAVATALNLFELFVQNNVWSVAPGRSAGFYVNPNISGEALVGYGLAFLFARSKRLGLVELILLGMVAVGTFATFSRAGILAGLVLLTTAVILRAERKQVPRIIVGSAIVCLVVFGFASFVVESLSLSDDALTRIASMVEAGGVGDYGEDRGAAALASLDLALESPLAGAGVGTISQMPEGPHNMFLAVLLEYGIGGLLLYATIIVRLLLLSRRAGRLQSAEILLFVGWLVIFSFASHNLLGNPATMPVFAIALAHAFLVRASGKAMQLRVIKEQGAGQCGS